MASSSREREIANAMNLARDSNITDLATEDRVRQLVIDYVFNSESESDHISDSDVSDNDDLVWGMPMPTATPTEPQPARVPGSVNVPGPSSSNTALVNSDDEVDDADLVVIDDTQPLLVNIAGETEDVEVLKIQAFKCGCKMKTAHGGTGCIKQYSEDEILNRRLDFNALSNGKIFSTIKL